MTAESEVLRSHVRVDGPAKVRGEATFAFDHQIAGLVYAAAVVSTVARGKIVRFELEEARRSPGVLCVLTYEDLAGQIRPVKHLMAGGFANSSALPMGSAEVHYAGQMVALVLGESQEAADEGAHKARVYYQSERVIGLLNSPGAAAKAVAAVNPSHKDPAVGDAQRAFLEATHEVDAVYYTPIQHHNPMELFGTICLWQQNRLTVYEATRYVDAAQHGLAAQLGIDASNVRVICPFIGGHFGSRLALSQYTAIVAIAARRLHRPVRYVASRAQGFTVANHRPDTQHHIRIAANQEGQFTAFSHEAEATTSRFDNFAMQGTDVTASLYAWRNVETKESVVAVDRNTPGPMRAPPEVPYLFALESAIDEMAEIAALDPIELRRRNDTARDPIKGKPFVPRRLMECFDAGAAAFGWAARNPKPQQMRRGEWLVGYGCAASVRPVKRAPATMRVVLTAEGLATVETAHHEIGNGIYTVLAMQAADRLGISVAAVTVRLGDSDLPAAGISGGSSTTTSLVPALAIACEQLRDRLAKAAFPEAKLSDVQMKHGCLVADGRSVKLGDAFGNLGETQIETLAEAVPEGAGADAIAQLRAGRLTLGGKESALKWGFGAQFAEVHVHAFTGTIRVARLVGAFSAGYIVNRLTAVSQFQGGMIWGLGAALLEATELDARSARYVNNNLAEYLVPTAADTGEVKAVLLDADKDPDPADLMGLGELGIIGVNAAIANAMHHATGRRFRRLPIRSDDVLEAIA